VQLIEILNERLAQYGRQELLDALQERGIPAGPINTVAEVFADPQVVHRAMQLDLGGIPGVRTPIGFSDAGLSLQRPAPRLGEHTQEILAELGMAGTTGNGGDN